MCVEGAVQETSLHLRPRLIQADSWGLGAWTPGFWAGWGGGKWSAGQPGFLGLRMEVESSDSCVPV